MLCRLVICAGLCITQGLRKISQLQNKPQHTRSVIFCCYIAHSGKETTQCGMEGSISICWLLILLSRHHRPSTPQATRNSSVGGQSPARKASLMEKMMANTLLQEAGKAQALQQQCMTLMTLVRFMRAVSHLQHPFVLTMNSYSLDVWGFSCVLHMGGQGLAQHLSCNDRSHKV